jgi:hypothetical protein
MRRTPEELLAESKAKQSRLERQLARAKNPLIGDCEAMARDLRKWATVMRVHFPVGNDAVLHADTLNITATIFDTVAASLVVDALDKKY